MGYLFRLEGEPLRPAQLALRKAVLAQVTKHPDSLDMSSWEVPEAGGCDTTRCIAGWAQFLARGFVRAPASTAWMGAAVATAPDDAIGLLGLTEAEYRGPDRDGELFYAENADAVEQLRALCEVEAFEP